MDCSSELLHRALKYYYGYDGFRRGQEEIITSILKGEPVLAILPTGAGKSICFQLPSLLLKGTTLVVSPLISLMKDQANNLNKRGITAAYLDSTMSVNGYGRVLNDILNNRCKFLYVSPERLRNSQFISFAQKANITLIAIDEAHCVSQWGRSFRKDYSCIPEFLKNLPFQPIMAAFTASATPEVRADILKKLNMKSAKIVVNSFDRPNLFFTVKKTRNKERAILNYLDDHKNECGIIYCSTRSNVETITNLLRENDCSVLRYHAGLTPEERKRNQNAFIDGSVKIIVATNAFGMGIDKPDVRFVLHYNMPKDLESYYQEAGRAGRDGNISECILLYSEEDTKINNYLIEKSESSDEVKKMEYNLLKSMSTYCNTSVCLRRYMLQYFGEKIKDDCGNCGSCRNNKKAKWRYIFEI